MLFKKHLYFFYLLNYNITTNLKNTIIFSELSTIPISTFLSFNFLLKPHKAIDFPDLKKHLKSSYVEGVK